jgi:hypothetical protein
MSTTTATAKKKKKASKAASPCIKCCFWGVEKRQHDIELSIAMNRIAQLEAELHLARLRIPVKKEMGEMACQTGPTECNDTACQTESFQGNEMACQTALPEYDDVACQTALPECNDVACQTALPEYDDVACQTALPECNDAACQTALPECNDVACQTEDEQDEQNEQYFTDTGTLIDGDEDDYQAWLLSKEEEDLSKDVSRVEEDVDILWCWTEDHKDVLFGAKALYPHFMGIITMCDDLYVNDGVLSLQRLRQVCEDLPFPYDDDEIRHHGQWFSLLRCLEARVPFWRSLAVHHRYSWYHTRVIEKEWVVERVYHFRFSQEKNFFLES